MVNISKFGDSAIKFKFTDNDHYLFNGEIEVPINSLLLVLDESDMVTFKKIDGDPFVSFLISNSNFASKNDLENFYKTSMVGSTGGGSESGITSGDVESMIEASLQDYYDIDEIDAALSGKADTSAVTESINAAVSGKADSSAVTQEISAAISGKADASDVETALSGKQDISGMTAYTTSSDVESYVSGYTYDKATIDSKVASGGTFDPTNYYDKTATDALLDNKFDASAFTSYSAATDARISEDEEVTAAAFNALNDELSGKQDTLIAGSGITISGNVISSEGGNNVIELTQAQYDALVTGGTVDPNAFYIITDATEINISDYYTSAQTQSAINAAVSGKADSSAVTEAINSAVSGKADTSAVTESINAAVSGKADSSAVTEAITAAVSGKADTSSVYTKSEVDTALSGKVDTSSVVTAVTSGSTDAEIPTAKAVYDAVGQGGSSYTAGRGISIENNEISFNLPISAGTGSHSILIGINHDASTFKPKATGTGAIAAGIGCLAAGSPSLAFGYDNKTYKQNSVVIGYGNSNNYGEDAFAFGLGNTISGGRATAVGGYKNLVKNFVEFGIGNSNITSYASTTFGDSGNTLFSVGNGNGNQNVSSTVTRHNAFEIRQNGDIYIADTNDTSTSNYYEKPMIKLQDALGGGSIDIDPSLDSGSTNAVANSAITSQFNSIDARLSEDEEVTAAALNALNDRVDAIDITVDDALNATSENPVQNKVIYAVIGDIESLLSNI